MKKIRVGKDIAIHWEITIDGVSQNLEDKDLTITMTDPTGYIANVELFTVDNNVITIAFRGTALKVLGGYTLTCWLNKGKEGQTVVDAVNCFELVRYSEYE